MLPFLVDLGMTSFYTNVFCTCIKVGFFIYMDKKGGLNMKIMKIINNNTVCVLDEKGKEQIMSGKGIGFGKKYGDEVDTKRIEKIYMVTDSTLQKKLIECLSEIPYEYIKLTDDLIRYISSQIHAPLNNSLIVTLSDHIAFAIERKKQGMEFSNPLMDSIHDCLPDELSLGKYCLNEIKEKLGIELHSDEAGFIAMHIINARMGTNMGQVPDITKMINGCADIADRFYSGKIDKTMVAYDRFLVHLKFLAKRLFSSQELPNVLSKDEELLSLIKLKFKKHYKCAKCIQDYILKNYAKTICEDEMLTLAIHLKKISE